MSNEWDWEISRQNDSEMNQKSYFKIITIIDKSANWWFKNIIIKIINPIYKRDKKTARIEHW